MRDIMTARFLVLVITFFKERSGPIFFVLTITAVQVPWSEAAWWSETDGVGEKWEELKMR